MSEETLAVAKINETLTRVGFAEKLRMARWSAAWRVRLLSDPSPAVVDAVMRSLALASEVEALSRRTDLPPRTLRTIRDDPRWSRAPRVRCALAFNPRMPFDEARRLLAELSDEELEYAAVSRRVTQPIADRAAELLRERRAARSPAP